MTLPSEYLLNNQNKPINEIEGVILLIKGHNTSLHNIELELVSLEQLAPITFIIIIGTTIVVKHKS